MVFEFDPKRGDGDSIFLGIRNGFAESLSQVDELILLDIYPAREIPIEGVDSQALLDKVDLTNKMLCTKGSLVDEISGKDLEILLTLGAGDIDKLVKPIYDALSTELKAN